MVWKSVLQEKVLVEEKKLINRKDMNWYWPELAISLAKNFRGYIEEQQSKQEQNLKINQIAPVVRETSDYFQVQEEPENRAANLTIPGDWHYIPMDVRAAVESSSDYQEDLQRILSPCSVSSRDLVSTEKST